MQQYACSSEAIACMCYFCHTLGNNPAAPPHRGENCRDPRNSHSKKAKPLHSSHSSVASSAAHRAPAALQSIASKPSFPPFSAAASSAAPPLFFIQTECGRYVDSSLPQGLVLSDHAAAAGRGQLFSMSHDGVITDVTTQLVLDCKEVKKGSSVVLTHPNGSSSQRWVMCPDGSIRLLDAAAALSLDVRRHIAALAPLIVWTPHGRANQRFRIVAAPPACHPAPPPPPPLASAPPPPPRACARAGCGFAVHTSQQSQGNTSHCCLQCQRDGSHSFSCQRVPAPSPASLLSPVIADLLSSAPSAPPVSSEPECQICMSASATHAAIPCGHRVLCGECNSQAQLSDCPVCRTSVTSFIRIY